MIGKVIKFDSKMRYGFIKGDDGVKYFVHSSDINIPSGNLDKGSTVCFTQSKNEWGPKALNVDLY